MVTAAVLSGIGTIDSYLDRMNTELAAELYATRASVAKEKSIIATDNLCMHNIVSSCGLHDGGYASKVSNFNIEHCLLVNAQP